jgi:hypothetical protein
MPRCGFGLRKKHARNKEKRLGSRFIWLGVASVETWAKEFGCCGFTPTFSKHFEIRREIEK